MLRTHWSDITPSWEGNAKGCNQGTNWQSPEQLRHGSFQASCSRPTGPAWLPQQYELDSAQGKHQLQRHKGGASKRRQWHSNRITTQFHHMELRNSHPENGRPRDASKADGWQGKGGAMSPKKMSPLVSFLTPNPGTHRLQVV